MQKKDTTNWQSFEKLGLIPRSIVRTFSKFSQQISKKPTSLAIYEFKISRYQTIASIKCLFNFILIPLIFHWLVFFSLEQSQTLYKWINRDIYSYSQTNPILQEVVRFDEKKIFDNLLQSSNASLMKIQRQNLLKTLKQEQIQCLQRLLYNLISDLMTLVVLLFFIHSSIPQLIILKSFFIEFIYHLNDTTKSFCLILITDLLVGFHSSKAWELFLLVLFQRFGILLQQDIRLLIISIFPVLLDTIFKYWIFRYLNRISPSTVATYQNMLE